MATTYTKYGIVSALILAIVFMFAVSFVKANPSFFIRQNNGTGTTATTSVSYMTAGAATTTKYMDTGVAGAGGTDSAILLEQLTGSSTASVLNTTFEYAAYNGADCIATPTACDWFATNLNSQATTSAVQNITASQSFSLAFASTSQGGVQGSGDGRILKAIEVKTPARYIRAILTLPTGSTNGAVWAEFLAKRQAP